MSLFCKHKVRFKGDTIKRFGGTLPLFYFIFTNRYRYGVYYLFIGRPEKEKRVQKMKRRERKGEREQG
jgi:hypothetical protein